MDTKPNVTVKKCFLLLLCVLTTLIYCVSIATSHWRESDKSPTLIVTGLWASCNDSKMVDMHECVDGEKSVVMHGWRRTCQGGAVMSLLATIIGMGLTLSTLRSRTVNKYVVSVLHLIGAVAFTITLVVYAVKFDNQTKHHLTGKIAYANYRLGWSYLLGWVAVMFSIGTMLLSMAALQETPSKRRRNEKPLIIRNFDV